MRLSDVKQLVVTTAPLIIGLILVALAVRFRSTIYSWVRAIFQISLTSSLGWMLAIIKISILCVLTFGAIRGIAETIALAKTTAQKTTTSLGGTSAAIAIIVTVIALFLTPSVKKIIYTQGGEQLVGLDAQPLNVLQQIATYNNINSSGDNTTVPQNYAYGMSFWLYVNSAAPNMSPSYSRFVSVLNHGNRPNILYRGDTNTLMVTMRNDYIGKKLPSSLNPMHNNERIIYTHTNVLMQKWNHVIINYSFGTMDIFINNKLVKSVPGVVPFSLPENTTIGEKDGLLGGIRSVVYFDEPLSANRMFYLNKFGN